MVFQYPDYQLFDSTVYDDICFGLKNLKLPEEEIRTRAYEAMELVGLDTKQDAENRPLSFRAGKTPCRTGGHYCDAPQILGYG